MNKPVPLMKLVVKLVLAILATTANAYAASPRTCPKGTKARQTNVQKGETLAGVAGRTKTSVADLQRWNRLNGPQVRGGQNLRYCVPVFVPGSVGSCNAGNLRGGVNLDTDGDRKGVGFVLPAGRTTSWGTPATVRHIRQCMSRYRANYKKGAPVNIGDLYTRDGGHVGNHLSHQSGRDVDLGFLTKPPQSIGVFNREATATNLDVQKEWTVIQCLLDNRETQFIFASWTVVNSLKAYVVKNRSLRSRYLKFFGNGVIQGDNEHMTHLHVRFRCPKGDRQCKG